ncbi:MAG TPA: protein-disulfide reductase DsbD N-terminal domain-containing protein, partial [Pyrinomonadaceae bacterium]
MPVIGAYSQSSPVTWTLNAPAKAVKSGGRFDARLTANIGGGWHLYSLTQPPGGPNATRISAASEPTFKLAGAIKSPKPKVEFDENFGINTESYTDGVTFTIPLQAAADVPAGKQTLGVNVRFQVCNETTCLPPRTVKVETIVEISASAAADTVTPANNLTAAATPQPTPTPTPKMQSTPQPTPTITATPAIVEQQSSIIAPVAENKSVDLGQQLPVLENRSDGGDSGKTIAANQSGLSGSNSALNQSLYS